MDTEIWLFFPVEKRSATAAARDTIRRDCRERSWQYQERSVRREPNGRGGFVRIVETRDAVAVYRRMHRARVAVLHMDRPRICKISPDERAISRDDTMSLENYCRYKAFRASGQSISDFVPAWIANFELWKEGIHCDGEHDPRCLPFPIFDANDTYKYLDDLEGRQKFEEAHYCRGRGRNDQRQLRWELNPRVFHGHDQLTVAGKELLRGCHWDVENDTGRPITIDAPLATWVVNSYVNIFPDGTIRGTPPRAKMFRK